MPTLPIELPASNPHLHIRQSTLESDSGVHGRVEITPQALAFLLPLFIVFIFGPILCVFCIKRRRRRNEGPRRPVVIGTLASLAGKRGEARRQLQEVTDVSSCIDESKSVEKTDSVSIAERECAICLSPLQAPSPPEPAKLSAAASGVDEVTRGAAVSKTVDADSEEILRLKVCGHEFHAECLISWFILWKFSCPICRALYYGKERKSSQTERSGEQGAPSEQRREEV